jgi:putative hydrolase of the HAD superfamily
MLDTIVFDMGLVLVNWHPAISLESLGLSRQDATLLASKMFSGQLWEKLDAGLITVDQALEAVQDQLPQNLLPMARYYAENWVHHMDLNQDVLDLVEKLLDAGWPLYLLSNASAPAVHAPEYMPVLKRFKGLFFSFEVQLLKPDPQIYLRMAQRFALDLQRCFFIDDSAENIAAAKALGMGGHQFRGDLSALKASLQDHGFHWNTDAVNN